MRNRIYFYTRKQYWQLTEEGALVVGGHLCCWCDIFLRMFNVQMGRKLMAR
jgi:hypothetical protein